jgi:hypothetical protein
MELTVDNIYAVRNAPRAPLPEDIQAIISKLKISFKPIFRRPAYGKQKQNRDETNNWRESALIDVVRKVREKDDADYDEISGMINKISKVTYAKLITEILNRMEKRDDLFRLRITTLLFDRGVRQPFYAPMMADVYKDIVKLHPDGLKDLMTQMMMFDALYDTQNITILPSGNDAGFDEALIAWSKQKEMKRGFAVYVSELYSRELVSNETMATFVITIIDDLKDSMKPPKTKEKEEHVDALVRFLVAVAPKVSMVKQHVKDILAVPRADTPCLCMKSRFKLEDIVR